MKHRIKGGISVPAHMDSPNESLRVTPRSSQKKSNIGLASAETFNIKRRKDSQEIVITEEKSLKKLDSWREPGFHRTLLGIENDCPLGGAIVGKKTAKVAFLDRQRVEKGLQSLQPVKIFQHLQKVDD